MSESKPARGRWYARWTQKTTYMGLLAFLGFAAVMGAVEFLLARGLWAFGEHYLLLSGEQTLAAYVAIQGLMLATAALAAWAVLAGDRYFMNRVWTGIFLMASAYAAYLGAEAAGWPGTGGLYVAGFAFAALRTWHAILARIARGTIPRYSVIGFAVMRWLFAFRETKAAFRLMVLEKLSPVEALAAVRGQYSPKVQTESGSAVDVSRVSKKEAIRIAFEQIGSYDAAKALAWLAERGVKVDRSYVYEQVKKEVAERRGKLRAAA